MDSLSIAQIRGESIAVLINLLRIAWLKPTRGCKSELCDDVEFLLHFLRFFRLKLRFLAWCCFLDCCMSVELLLDKVK